MLKGLVLISFIFILGCSNVEKTQKDLKEKNVLLLKGVNSYSVGEKSRALNYYNKVLELDNKNILALRESGIIYSQLNKNNEAKEKFEKVLEFDKNDELSLKYLAYLEFKNENYKKSLEYLEKVPENLLSEDEIILKGYSYYLLKNYGKSLKSYLKVDLKNILKNEKVTKSYIESLEKNYSSEIVYKKLVELGARDSFNYKSSLMIANKLIEQYKDYKEAEKILRLYLTNNSLEQNILNKLVEVYYMQGKKKEADRVLKLKVVDFE